jgi:hypothetical protein
MRGFSSVLLALGLVNPANADWLAEAWPDDASPRHGTPAITIIGTGAVSVVLPAEVLADAPAAGLSTEAAVSAFLGRYAPRMCSSLIDMNVPHQKLKVDLRVQRLVAQEDIDGGTQEDAASALNHVLKSPGAGSVPRIRRAFVVDQKRLSLSIDYAPDHKVNCVEPPDTNF